MAADAKHHALYMWYLRNRGGFSDKGGAVLMPEKECTAEALWNTVTELLADPARMEAMGKAQKEACILDSAQRICDVLEELAG
jgi:UDP-N-acetylglucosamine--N-acetylmuramyl-(pentapeptide) pyrophosphoryl-undecaprenol N-acetylglucosamine transferase